jgi:hypothetical protein
MWKTIAERTTHLAEWPWRKILADAALLTAFAVTSSLLMR